MLLYTETIADQLALWSDAGVEGINVVSSFIPGSYEEFIDLVLPVLRKRGLARENNSKASTLRNTLFGEYCLSDRHPARKYSGAFTKKEVSN